MPYDLPVLKLFAAVAERLATAGFDFCLVGGLAVSIHAQPRATKDIDFVIALPVEERQRLREVLRQGLGFLQARDEPVRFANATVWRLVFACPRSVEGVLLVDFLFADTRLLASVLARALPTQLGSLNCRVATPEDLMLMKLQAGRPQDVADIAALREAYAGQLDEAYLDKWRTELGLREFPT